MVSRYLEDRKISEIIFGSLPSKSLRTPELMHEFEM